MVFFGDTACTSRERNWHRRNKNTQEGGWQFRNAELKVERNVTSLPFAATILPANGRI
jgi:hypothetical protein